MGAIVHTHSPYATAWSSLAGRALVCLIDAMKLEGEIAAVKGVDTLAVFK